MKMRKRTFWVILSCLTAAFLVLSPFGATMHAADMVKDPSTGKMVEKPRYGGILNTVMYDDPTVFDVYRHDPVGIQIIQYYLEKPLIADWSTDRKVTNFDSGFVPPTTLVGNLAESWEIPDPLTLILKVRKGIKWHNKPPVNGREFVASDIAFAYHRMCGLGSGFEKPTPYSFYDELKKIKSVEVPDKYTVVFKFKEPHPVFPLYLGPQGHMGIMAPEVIKKHGAFPDWKVGAIGTGPFMLKDYVKGSAITFVKNPDYWKNDEKFPENKLPYVDGVRVSIMKDAPTIMAAVRVGKIDLTATGLGVLSGSKRDTLAKTNPELKFYGRFGECKNIGMNYQAKPFTDIRVRKAMQMAMDLKTIAETYYSGYASWFPSLCGKCLGEDYWSPFEDYPEEVQEAFTYNPKKAKQLLAEAGYPNGFKTNVVTRGFGFVDLLEIVQAYLADIGVTLEIKAMEYTAGNAFLYGRQHDQMYYLRACGCWDPVEVIRYWYTPTKWNWGDISDPIYDAMYENITKEPNLKKRAEVIKRANFYGTSQFFGIFMPHEKSFAIGQPWVKGWQGEGGLGPYMQGPVHARIWIDQKLKKR